MSSSSREREDLATLSAVAEAVVNLSIAERTQTMYGKTHPIAERARGTATRAIERALDLVDPVVLRFTPLAVFCGSHCLERDHPIYRRFARKLWELGIGELALSRGLDAMELTRFLAVVGEGTRTRASHRAMERCLAETDLPHLRARTLGQLIETEARSEVTPLDPEEERKQWDRLMRRLGHPGDAPTAESKETQEELEHTAQPADYATAVVDYMRQVQRARRQEEILERSETGQKLVRLMEEMNPELRHQVLSQAIVAPDLDASFLARLADLTGRDEFVESLRRLNEQGAALPPSVFQTLALLSSVAPTGDESDPEAGIEDLKESRLPLSQGIGALFDHDQRESYVHPAYERTLSGLQSKFRGLSSSEGRSIEITLDLSPVTTERHFLFTMQELLDGSGIAEREDLRKRVLPEVEASFVRLLEEGRVVACREAVRMARDLRAEALEAGEETDPAPWEEDDFLESLLGPEEEGPAAESIDALRALLVTIGAPVLDGLVERLRLDERIATRKLALDTLVSLEESPAAALLPLLTAAEPWYVHRNALHVLGERKEAAGADAAIALWPAAGSRSRAAILRYLVEVADEGVGTLWKEALGSDEPELVLVAARMALDAEQSHVSMVMEAARSAAETRRASPLHFELLRLLALRGGPDGRAFVERARTEQAPRMPWRRGEWHARLDRILGERA